MNLLANRMMRYFAHHSKICIIGGGTGGVNVSAHMLRSRIDPRDITIFQPQKYHYYQPGWTLVGAGMGYADSTRELMEKVIPEKVHVVKQQVKIIHPEKNLIITDRNHQFTYEQLIISSGFVIDWQKIKGAKQLLQDPLSKVCSVFDYTYAQKTASLGKRFQGGKAIFTQPKLPIKCAGAPMKIAFLLADQWSKKHFINLHPEIFKAQPTMFPVQKYSDAIDKLAKIKGFKVNFQHNLIEVTPEKAIFQHIPSKQKVQKNYDFLHIAPPMSPPSFISQSGLGNAAGFVNVHDNTLRHLKYPNIWSLGDSSSLPCSKTATAIYTQTPVLIKNILAVMQNSNIKQLPGYYNGYTGCPIFVGDKKAILVEFKYNKQIDQSFFKDQSIPRTLFYYMTKYFFPFAYWKLMPRGLWKGRDGIRWRQKL